jgi:hypothetical protein
MATIYDSLKTVSGYPIPHTEIEVVAIKRGVNLGDTLTSEVMKLDSYRLAQADLMKWVSTAPNISQGDVSFDILYSDRERLREQANAVYGEFGEGAGATTGKRKYGYMGNRF